MKIVGHYFILMIDDFINDIIYVRKLRKNIIKRVFVFGKCIMYICIHNIHNTQTNTHTPPHTMFEVHSRQDSSAVEHWIFFYPEVPGSNPGLG